MEQKKLGFGCMRLPISDKEDQSSIDFEQLNRMVDIFLERELLISIQPICIIIL